MNYLDVQCDCLDVCCQINFCKKFSISLLLLYYSIINDKRMPNLLKCESTSKLAFSVSFWTVVRSEKILIF